MAAFKLASAKAIGALIATAVGHVNSADTAVHDAAVQSVAHAEKHGDWTLVKTLMLGLKNSGYRYQGVRIWIEGFSPLRFPADRNAEGGFTIKVLKAGDDGFTPYNINGMWSTKFTDYEPSNERTGRPVYADDFVGGIMRSKERFLRLLSNTNNDGTPKDNTKPYYRGDVAAMLSFLSQVEAIHVPEDRTKLEDEKAAQREAEQGILGAAANANAAVLGADAEAA